MSSTEFVAVTIVVLFWVAALGVFLTWREGGRRRRDETVGEKCMICGAPAEWLRVRDDGTVHGYICGDCDYQESRRRSGWSGRMRARMRRRFHR